MHNDWKFDNIQGIPKQSFSSFPVEFGYLHKNSLNSVLSNSFYSLEA
jgi:hypothetical protein